MTELSTEQLKKSFHQEMIHLYKKMIKLIKYKPTRLIDYINKYGGYEAAVKYINTESNVQDFAVLWEKERLDLSVEALITSENYRSLFQEEVLVFCDRKLKEYSYAPRKIEEVEESSGYFDENEKVDLIELLKQKESYLPKIKKKEYPMYYQSVDILVNDWKVLLLDQKVVTANNLDLLLRIYAIGDSVGPKELAQEDGYSVTYPYKEVVMALAKRIKVKLKVDIPVGEDGKILWWHLLFNGGLKDNTDFEWSLKNPLRKAIDLLIAEGQIEKVTTNSQTELQEIKEEKRIKEEVTEKVQNSKNEGSISAFDRLFESIMGNCSNDQKEVPKEEQPVKQSLELAPHKIDIIREVEEEKVVISTKAKETNLMEEATNLIADDSTDYKERIKKDCLSYYGAICDICGFDFGYTYGDTFESLIGVHNVRGLEGDEILPTTHPTEDLIPICQNCHYVMHSTTPPISVEKMRKMVKA